LTQIAFGKLPSNHVVVQFLTKGNKVAWHIVGVYARGNKGLRCR